MSLYVEISQLKFSYDTKNTILDIDKFRIESGEILFLQGPSGSGKSTLLEILAGVNKPTSGSVKMNDHELSVMSHSELDKFRAENIGYIFQSFNLIPYLNVQQNILLPSLFTGDGFSASELDTIVASLGLKDFLNRQVSQLSVGQQQRVAVARALIKKPKLLLADEPTSSLDYDHREKFLRLMFELCKKLKTTVLFVSHDLSIKSLFDRSVSLHEINNAKPKNQENL